MLFWCLATPPIAILIRMARGAAFREPPQPIMMHHTARSDNLHTRVRCRANFHGLSSFFSPLTVGRTHCRSEGILEVAQPGIPVPVSLERQRGQTLPCRGIV